MFVGQQWSFTQGIVEIRCKSHVAQIQMMFYNVMLVGVCSNNCVFKRVMTTKFVHVSQIKHNNSIVNSRH
jgi:hypothetical protein